MDTLSQFLRAAAARTFRLGEFDCGLWLADWYMAKTGKPDPAAHLRGKQYGPDELAEHIAPIVEALKLESIAPREVARGDIGIMHLPDQRITGAICTGSKWCFLGAGVASAPVRDANILSAWRIE